MAQRRLQLLFSFHFSPRTKQKLRSEMDEKPINEDLEMMMDEIEKGVAEAGYQPRQQP